MRRQYFQGDLTKKDYEQGIKRLAEDKQTLYHCITFNGDYRFFKTQNGTTIIPLCDFDVITQDERYTEPHRIKIKSPYFFKKLLGETLNTKT